MCDKKFESGQRAQRYVPRGGGGCCENFGNFVSGGVYEAGKALEELCRIRG